MKMRAGGVAAAATQHQYLPGVQSVAFGDKNLRAVTVGVPITIGACDYDPMSAVTRIGHLVDDSSVHGSDFGTHGNCEIPRRVVMVGPV
jgi:hypothetical protein